MIGTQHAITEESTTEAATTSRLTGARMGPAGAADQVGTSLPRRASAIDALHESVVQNRRATVLAGHLAALLPAACRTVLDVGCGDGVIDALLLRHRPELTVIGLDVIERPGARIDVRPFDGLTLPYADRSHDAVMLIDVLHHTNDPIVLLREAARVARRAVVVKDHLREGFLAGPTLRFMDRVGNRRYGVPLPYTYWRTEQWGEAFRSLGLHVERWRDRLGLYAWPLHLLFERSLHFAARLTVASGQSEEGP